MDDNDVDDVDGNDVGVDDEDDDEWWWWWWSQSTHCVPYNFDLCLCVTGFKLKAKEKNWKPKSWKKNRRAGSKLTTNKQKKQAWYMPQC